MVYADNFSYDYLVKNMYPGQTLHDLVIPYYTTEISNLSCIGDNCMDFVVTYHVIEHTTNPIAALDEFYRILKHGGHLLLVVPDMEKTFDSERKVTSLEHLIDDYLQHSHEKDLEHYVEFYTKTHFRDFIGSENPEEFIARKHKERENIHFHTWTYESFKHMIDWHSSLKGWIIEFCHPTLDGGIEFYFILKKN